MNRKRKGKEKERGKKQRETGSNIDWEPGRVGAHWGADWDHIEP